MKSKISFTSATSVKQLPDMYDRNAQTQRIIDIYESSLENLTYAVVAVMRVIYDNAQMAVIIVKPAVT